MPALLLAGLSSLADTSKEQSVFLSNRQVGIISQVCKAPLEGTGLPSCTGRWFSRCQAVFVPEEQTPCNCAFPLGPRSCPSPQFTLCTLESWGGQTISSEGLAASCLTYKEGGSWVSSCTSSATSPSELDALSGQGSPGMHVCSLFGP